MLGIDTVDDLTQQFPTPSLVRRNMGIAELHDAITVEGCRQVLRSKLYMADLQAADTNKRAVNQYIPED